MQITADDPETGYCHSDLECIVTGDEHAIALNGRYLADSLNAIDAPEVAIETNGAKTP